MHAHAVERGLLEAGMLFVTLTQPRLRETPAEALARLVATWRRVTTSRPGRVLFGGPGVSFVRALEVTWSPHHKGDWHPHYHLLAVVDPQWAADLVTLWMTKSGGAAAAQHVRAADSGSCVEALKYAVKGIERIPSASASALFGALVGRRLITCTGAWSGWRDAGLRLPAMAMSGPIDDQLLDAIRPVEAWIAQGRTLPELVAAAAGVDSAVANLTNG